MSKTPEINVVHVWLPMKSDALDVKQFDDYPFTTESGIIQSASSLRPVFRYAKNYTKNEARFSLCMISLQKDRDAIEEFLDKTAEQIDPIDYIGRVFSKTEMRYQP